jgi:hypothetical protein
VELPDGLVAFVQAECPTCQMVVPVLRELHDRGPRLTIYTQDDPDFPKGFSAVHDADLRLSWDQEIRTVPTLLRVEGGAVTASLEGWRRSEWEQLTGVVRLGDGLPEYRPGCGSLSVDPAHAIALARRFGSRRLGSRAVQLAGLEDEFEAMYERGWTDGLPVVPPTPDRVLAMLDGTERAPDDVVAIVPPDLVECTVEKIAVNAVMAGCRPEYLPIVIAGLEAACADEFNMHGLLATTWFAGPILIVNGPIRMRLGMNSGVNVFGPGNRANASIGRALQLVVRNVGGGRPGGVDRATFGTPGKYTFCFAENEEGSPWEPLSVARGVALGVSAVTLFGGYGVHPLSDQRSRTASDLAATFARGLAGVSRDAVLVVSPDHARLFREAGWSRPQLIAALTDRSGRDASTVLVVHAGGGAGLFSALLPGWVGGAEGSQPVTRPIDA